MGRVGPDREWIADPHMYVNHGWFSTPVTTPESDRYDRELLDAETMLAPWRFCRHCMGELIPPFECVERDDGSWEAGYLCDRCGCVGRTSSDIRNLSLNWPNNDDAFDQ